MEQTDEGEGLETEEEETATEGDEGVFGVEALVAAAGVAGALPPPLLLVLLLLVERRARAMTSESAERATSGAAVVAEASLLLLRRTSLGSGIFFFFFRVLIFHFHFFLQHLSAAIEKNFVSMDAFESFDFDASPAWKRYQEDSVLTTDADALLLAKAKWYKKNVIEDKGFDVDLVRKKLSSSRGGAAAAGASGGSSSSSRSAPGTTTAPPPPPSQPKPPPTKKTTTATPPPRTRPASSSTRRPPLSSLLLSPRALLSSLSSASPLDAAALASRLATLVTGLAFLLACASAWLAFFGIRFSKFSESENDYYSPRRGRAASASAAAFRKFALSASISHFAALVQQCGAPPVAAAFRGGSFNPQALGPLLAWLRRASEAPEASLLFFLMLSSSSPSAPAVVPSLVAALLALLESTNSSSSSSSSSSRGLSSIIGRVLFPGPVRPLLQDPSRQRSARAAAAASELAQGLWLVLSTILGKGGGFLTAMGFWRTYVPMRLRSGSGGEFRAAAVGLAGGAARAARKVSGGGNGSGGGVAVFFERLESKLRSSSSPHSD